MMKFEEQFPSLKGKHITVPSNITAGPFEIDGKLISTNMELFAYMQNIIQKHCLDKQKVREVFEKEFCGWQEEATTKWSSVEERKEAAAILGVLQSIYKELGILKELGLEKEE